MTSEKKVNKVGLVAVISLLTLLPMGLLGAFLGENNRLTGFAWGIGIGIALFVVMAIGTFGWEWIKKEADKGKLLPYLIVGFIVAIAISGFLAINLGSPSCDEYESDPRGSCISYADDGFEATSEQKWSKFWGTLPVTVIISLLVAYIVHSQTEKKRPKHFKSVQDGFSVSIFPETISVNLDEDGNSYKYSPSYGPKYTVDVTQLDDFPSSSHKALGVVESWHRNIVSAATKVPVDKVDYEKGEKQGTPYLYGSYPLKKDATYYHLTLARYGKIYGLSMYIQSLEHENKSDIDKVFSEFVDSFTLT